MKLDLETRTRKLLTRFNHCYDGVLRGVRFRFAPTAPVTRASVTLSVRQPARKGIREQWVNIRLLIKDVKEYAIRESDRESCRILSGGLQVWVYRDLLFFDFSPYSVTPKGVDDYRRSGFYIAGRSFAWKVEAYSENGSTRSRQE